MPRPANPLAHPVAVAQRWLGVVATHLNEVVPDPPVDDDTAYRITRAWLQIVRDRLPVIDAAHFAAQLPDLLRGTYYEGWRPGHVPQKYDRAGFVARFAREADVPPADVPAVARAVSEALAGLLSGHLDLVLHHFTADLREMLAPLPPAALHELLDH